MGQEIHTSGAAELKDGLERACEFRTGEGDVGLRNEEEVET